VAIDYTTTYLVESLKRKASFPSSQSLFTDLELISFFSEELRITVVPLIIKAREEFFVESVDFSTVTNQAQYDIPSAAIGARIRDLLNVQPTGALIRIPRMAPEDFSNFNSNWQQPSGFYIESNKIVLIPTPTRVVNLRLTYFHRRNQLVPVAQAGQVLNVVGTLVTLSSVPDDWAAQTEVDFVMGEPNFDVFKRSAVIQARAGFDLTFLSADITDLAAGDWISLEGETPIPAIPLEAFDVLIQAVVVRILLALNLQGAAKNEFQLLQEMKNDLLSIIVPRVEAQPKSFTAMGGILGSMTFPHNWSLW